MTWSWKNTSVNTAVITMPYAFILSLLGEHKKEENFFFCLDEVHLCAQSKKMEKKSPHFWVEKKRHLYLLAN